MAGVNQHDDYLSRAALTLMDTKCVCLFEARKATNIMLAVVKIHKHNIIISAHRLTLSQIANIAISNEVVNTSRVIVLDVDNFVANLDGAILAHWFIRVDHIADGYIDSVRSNILVEWA